jgi:hypothetical protein
MAKLPQGTPWCPAKWGACDDNIVEDGRGLKRRGPHECSEAGGHDGGHVCSHCNRPK